MTQLAKRVLVFPQVSVMGAHPAGIKYTGKYGYPVKSDLCVDNMSTTDAVASYDALLIPGGFAPDYMRRNQAMLDLTVAMAGAGRVVASICHGPWMLCSARRHLLLPASCLRLNRQWRELLLRTRCPHSPVPPLHSQRRELLRGQGLQWRELLLLPRPHRPSSVL